MMITVIGLAGGLSLIGGMLHIISNRLHAIQLTLEAMRADMAKPLSD